MICLLSFFNPDAFPQFNEKYGIKLADGTYQVPASWQSGLSNVSFVECDLGPIACSESIVNDFGRVPTWERSLVFSSMDMFRNVSDTDIPS